MSLFEEFESFVFPTELAEPMITFLDNRQFCDVILVSGVDKKKYEKLFVVAIFKF